MTLPVPDHIQTAGIVDRQLTFPWDEWKLLPYYNHDAGNWHARLSTLSIRAQLALMNAAGEWVCHRFSSVDSDVLPLQLLEAAWAGVVSPAYVQMLEPEEEQWRGPARGPLHILMLIVTDAFNNLEIDSDGATRAVWMYNLAQHVLPRTDAFNAWFQEIVDRLERYHPRPGTLEGDLFSGLPPGMGIPVPRESFDPRFTDDRAHDAALLDAFLQGLDWQLNPFLRSPELMAEDEFFEGTPYRYP